MVQTGSGTSRLHRCGVPVPSCGLCLAGVHKRKRIGKLSKKKETKRCKVTIVDAHDDPASDADDSILPIENAEASQEWRLLIEEADYYKGSFRCHAKLDTVVTDLHKFLTDTQKEMFRKSSFAFLLDIDPSRIRWSPQLVRSILFRQVNHPSNKEMWFRLGENVVKFGKLEWALITGLKFDGQMIRDCDLPRDERLKDMYFADLQSGISKSRLQFTFRTLTQISDDDRVKLALAYAIDRLFFAKPPDRNVDPFILKIVDHMDLFNKHPWGLVTYKFTLTELRKAMNGKVQGFRMKKSPDLDQKVKVGHNLYGFPHVLQVWAYETITSLEKQFAEKTHKDNIPRILCWTVYDTGKFDTLQEVVFKTKELRVTPLKPSANEKRQCYTRGLCGPENAADRKVPEQKDKCEIEADPVDDDESINGSSSSNEDQVASSSEFTKGITLFRNELLQYLSFNRHRQGKTAKKDSVPKKQMELLTQLASLMGIDVADENQDHEVAVKHKRAPKEVSPMKVSQSLKSKKGQSSDAEKAPTEEADNVASPLDDKQSDEERPKISENKRVRPMRTIVKMVKGKRSSSKSIKGVRLYKMNKNLKVSSWTAEGANKTSKQQLTRRQFLHDVLDDEALHSPVFSEINLTDEPPSNRGSCFQQNEVDNFTSFHKTELPGLENNEVSFPDSSYKNHYLNLYNVEVVYSGMKGQEGAIESVGKDLTASRGLELAAADSEPVSSSQHQDVFTSSAVRVAVNMELESPASLSVSMAMAAESVEDNHAKKNTSFYSDNIASPELKHERVVANNEEVLPADPYSRSCVSNLYTLEVEGSDSGDQQAPVESSGMVNIIGKGFEFATTVEPPSSSRYHDTSTSIENDNVAENREAAVPVIIDLTTEEDEAEHSNRFHASEITGLEIEARIRRVQRMVEELKRARYSHPFLDKTCKVEPI